MMMSKQRSSTAWTQAALTLTLVAGCTCEGGTPRTAADSGAARDAFSRIDAVGPDTNLANVDATDICASVEVSTRLVTPEVTVIVDQSLSMENVLSGGVSRWDAVHNVLTGPTGLVTETERVVRYGLALYSDVQGGSPRCPIVTPVPSALNNRAAINTAFTAADPMGETPTGDSINAILSATSPDPTDDPRIFILATDGGPDRCGMPDAHDDASRNLSIAAVQRAYTMGIRTFVIGVGSGSVPTSHLQALARAGQGGAATAMHYEAGDVAALTTAMRTIVRGEISCTLELDGRVDPMEACAGDVRLNGINIRCDDVNGWRPIDETHIEILGTRCETLTTSDVARVQATFPCSAIIL
jgi:hypothetical protein